MYVRFQALKLRSELVYTGTYVVVSRAKLVINYFVPIYLQNSFENRSNIGFKLVLLYCSRHDSARRKSKALVLRVSHATAGLVYKINLPTIGGRYNKSETAARIATERRI